MASLEEVTKDEEAAKVRFYSGSVSCGYTKMTFPNEVTKGDKVAVVCP